MRLFKRIPGIDSPGRSDFPVLAPGRKSNSLSIRFAGLAGWRPEVKAWHVAFAVCLFALSVGVAEAQTRVDYGESVFTTLWRWMPLILKGFGVNLLISVVAMTIGTIAGMMLGLAQVSQLKGVRAISYVITQFFRNSPWLVLLFFMTLTLPFEVRIGGTSYIIPDWIKATIGFSLPVMANISEVVRGAVQSIPFGQWEAAESLAFTRRQVMWRIILPQCFKRMLPPWMNWYAILALATPVCFIMGVEESVAFAKQAIDAEDGRPELIGPFYFFVMTLFFIYIYPIGRATVWLEKKFAIKT